MLVPLVLLQRGVDLVTLASRIMVCVPFGMGADAFAGLAFTTAGRMSGGFFGHGGGGNTRASTGA